MASNPFAIFFNVHVIDVDLNATRCPSLTLRLYSWVIVYPILVERRDFYSHRTNSMMHTMDIFDFKSHKHTSHNSQRREKRSRDIYITQ